MNGFIAICQIDHKVSIRSALSFGLTHGYIFRPLCESIVMSHIKHYLYANDRLLYKPILITNQTSELESVFKYVLNTKSLINNNLKFNDNLFLSKRKE